LAAFCPGAAATFQAGPAFAGQDVFPLAAARGDAQTAALDLNPAAPSAALGPADAWAGRAAVHWAGHAKRPEAGLDFPLAAARGFLSAKAARELLAAMASPDAADQLPGQPQQVALTAAAWSLVLREPQGAPMALPVAQRASKAESALERARRASLPRA